MSPPGNGSKPDKSAEEVATELRQRLEHQLGRERTDAIWRDPKNIGQVIDDDEEAASVAGTILQAWKELPPERGSNPSRTHSGFRRGLQIALITAVAVWAIALLRRARQGGAE